MRSEAKLVLVVNWDALTEREEIASSTNKRSGEERSAGKREVTRERADWEDYRVSPSGSSRRRSKSLSESEAGRAGMSSASSVRPCVTLS